MKVRFRCFHFILPLLAFLLVHCGVRVQEVPFPDYSSSPQIHREAREEFFTKFSSYFSKSEISSYRFLAKSKYSDQEGQRTAKQIFIFAPPNRLRIEEYSSLGNQLVMEILVDGKQARVRNVLQNEVEIFSNVEELFEHFLGEKFSVGELLALFLGRCLSPELASGVLTEIGGDFVVHSPTEQESCIMSKDGQKASWVKGEGGFMNLQVDWRSFQTVESLKVPSWIRFWSPKHARTAEFRLEHIGVNKPLSETLFTPF